MLSHVELFLKTDFTDYTIQTGEKFSRFRRATKWTPAAQIDLFILYAKNLIGAVEGRLVQLGSI